MALLLQRAQTESQQSKMGNMNFFKFSYTHLSLNLLKFDQAVSSQSWREYTLHVISRNAYHQGQVLDICTSSLALVNHVQL